MKTLNEVIKANECCDHGEPDSRCEDCPYNGIGACCAERESDALYYLKTIETTENLYHDAVNELSKWKDEDWKDRYLPLTWDELQLMEGKPVWIEGSFITGGPHWIIVGPSHLYNGKIVGYGKTWQAYRKERNETN